MADFDSIEQVRPRMMPRVITACAVAMCVGCGEVQNINQDARLASDAGDRPSDAPAGSPWRMVSRVDELSTTDARGPSMTGDRLELYFTGSRAGGPGGYDIYKSTRTTAQGAWSSPVPVTELSSPATDADPYVSADGLTLWFSTDRDAVQSFDIWVSVRASRNAVWGSPVPVKELNTVKSDASPSVTSDGLAMVFDSRRAGQDSDIYLSTRVSVSAPWGTPVPVAAVNSTADDADPGLSGDGLQLYVTSARSGGRGSSDLWLARRASRLSDFGPPDHVAELDTDGIDEAPWIASDDRLIVFSRQPLNASFGIYQAVR